MKRRSKSKSRGDKRIRVPKEKPIIKVESILTNNAKVK
jgi:hypothetical protein